MKHLWLEDSSASAPRQGCDSYIKVLAVLPTSVAPKPPVDLEMDQDWQKFVASLPAMRVEANFVGIFEPYFVWRKGKRLPVAQDVPFPFRKKGGYDARIVLRNVSEIDARRIPRR